MVLVNVMLVCGTTINLSARFIDKSRNSVSSIEKARFIDKSKNHATDCETTALLKIIPDLLLFVM